MARIGQTKNELDNADAADQRFRPPRPIFPAFTDVEIASVARLGAAFLGAALGPGVQFIEETVFLSKAERRNPSLDWHLCTRVVGKRRGR